MKKKKLEVSPDLSLPLEAITNTFAILARRRVGKTYTASVMAEEMIAAGLPFVVLDPTGAWWGLSSSADGKAEGLPVIIIGGPHAHIPLEPSAGKVIADLVVDHPGFYIIDFSRFNHRADEIQFAAAFGERLYRRKQHLPSALHLFIDEADVFVPQKLPKNGKEMFDAYDQIVRRGGVYGLGVTLISQRPALVNKDVLTQCAVLMALRASAPEDQDPIFDKVSRNGTQEQVSAIKKSLASLSMGEAWYFEPDRDIFKKIKIRERHTFNSSATPKPGVAAIEPKIFSQIDIDSLGEKIKLTVEKARMDDPNYLRRKIQELEMQLLAKPKPEVIQAAQPVRVEVPVMDEKQYKLLLAGFTQFGNSINKMMEQRNEFNTKQVEQLRQLNQSLEDPKNLLASIYATLNNRPIAPSPRREVIVKQAITQHKTFTPQAEYKTIEGITSPQQKILDAMAWLESVGLFNPKRTVIAFLAGQSPRSSGFGNNLGALRSSGMITYPNSDSLAFTDEGRNKANQPKVPADSFSLQQSILTKLPRPQSKILEILIEAEGQPVDRTELAQQAGQSPTSSGYGNNLGALRSLGVIDYPTPTTARALDVLWVDRR